MYQYKKNKETHEPKKRFLKMDTTQSLQFVVIEVIKIISFESYLATPKIDFNCVFIVYVVYMV